MGKKIKKDILKKKNPKSTFLFPFLGHGERQYKKGKGIDLYLAFTKTPTPAGKKWIQKQLIPDILSYEWLDNILIAYSGSSLIERIYEKYDEKQESNKKVVGHEPQIDISFTEELLYNKNNWNNFNKDIDHVLLAVHEKYSIVFVLRSIDECELTLDKWHNWGLPQIQKKIFPIIEEALIYIKNKKIKKTFVPSLLYYVLYFFQEKYRSKSFSLKEKEKLISLIVNSAGLDSYIDTFNADHLAELLKSFSKIKNYKKAQFLLSAIQKFHWTGKV